MGMLKDIVSKVKEEVAPLASVMKEEMANKMEKVVDRVLQSPMLQTNASTSVGSAGAASAGAGSVGAASAGTSAASQDEWAFKPMASATAASAAGSSPVESATAGRTASAAPVAPQGVAASSSSPVEQAAPASTAPVKITAHPSPTDPSTCKFTAEVPVFEEQLIRVRSREQAEASPLARRIFDIPQVKTVTFAGNVVTVTKQGPEPWPVIARQVGPAIRAFLASGEPAIGPDFVSEASATDKDDGLALRVQNVIETMINPGVAGHGGYVTLLGVKSEIAYIKMGGGCQGCGAADVTLKQGIVTTIKAHVPEIQDVLDSTDHGAGENPFYRGEMG